MIFKINQEIEESFIPYDEYNNRVSNVIFGTTAYVNGLQSNTPIIITEMMNSGVYNLSYTPSVTGNWVIDIHSATANITMQATYNVVNYVTDDIAPSISTLYNIGMGKWVMTNNQLILYDLSNVIIQTFNLYDINGNPSLTGVTRREPV